MPISRRTFLSASSAAIGAPAVSRALSTETSHVDPDSTSVRHGSHVRGVTYDPWIEVIDTALVHNARTVAQMVGGRPVLAVVKNNAYGLGLELVARVLEDVSEVVGFAVVKTDQALALRDSGINKPILLMGLATDDELDELVARGVAIAAFSDGSAKHLQGVGERLDQNVHVHLYLDTGMNRLGMSFRRAIAWMSEFADKPRVQVDGTFMTFTEEDDLDPIQLERLEQVVAAATKRGFNTGRVHAASSHGLFFRHDAFLDMVRPGLALYGAYPSGAREAARIDLRPAFRLRARVVRVERLEPGDTVSYGRGYTADRPVWVATLPVGHADGYPRAAVNGCEVLIGDSLYPAIGAVSASHTIIEIGERHTVQVGDEATLIGPDRPAIHPNAVAAAAGVSVYDILMHLNEGLPRTVLRANRD